MYIVDNLGNVYDHKGGSGAAYDDIVIENGVPYIGTFEFLAPPSGAYSFDFHDDNQNMVINNIRLTEPIILYGDLKLVNTPYTLAYLLEYWDLVTGDTGGAVLAHKQMPNLHIGGTAVWHTGR